MNALSPLVVTPRVFSRLSQILPLPSLAVIILGNLALWNPWDTNFFNASDVFLAPTDILTVFWFFRAAISVGEKQWLSLVLLSILGVMGLSVGCVYLGSLLPP